MNRRSIFHLPKTLKSRGFVLILTLQVLVLLSVLIFYWWEKSTYAILQSSSYVDRLCVDFHEDFAFERALGDLRQDLVQRSQKVSIGNGQLSVYHPLKTEETSPHKMTEEKTIPELVRMSQHSDLNLSPETKKTAKPSDSSTWKQAGWGELPNFPEWLSIQFRAPEKKQNGIQVHAKEIRYAYAVYDEGGALDLNEAGSPDSKSSSLSGKGASFWADLTRIPGWNQSLSDRLFDWRTGKNNKSKTDFNTWLLETKKRGFQWAGENEMRFFSRRDMLGYLKEKGVSETSTPYFTHFNRELNQASTSPSFNGRGFAGFKYANQFQFLYKDEANQKWIGESRRMYNRDFAGLIRDDGTPLIRQRFSLRRIDLLKTATVVTKSDDIYKYFGMTRASAGDSWIYDHGAKDGYGNTKIYQLNDPEFLAQNREPDFFELLQAGILYGSTGLTCNSSDLVVGTTFKRVCESSFLSYAMDAIDVPTQILKIGLNIIDQWDEDSIPTRLQVIGRDYPKAGLHGSSYPPIASDGSSIKYSDKQTVQLMGQENIPYVNQIGIVYYRLLQNAVSAAVTQTSAARNTIFSWFVPEIWNIYRSPSTSSGSSLSLRMAATDGSPDMTKVDYNYLLAGVPTGVNGTPGAGTTVPAGSTQNYRANLRYILYNYSTAAQTRTPSYITRSLSRSAQSDAACTITNTGDANENDFCGIPMAAVTCSLVTPANPFNTLKQINVKDLYTGASTPVTLQWQMQASNGTWVPIQNFSGFTLGNTSLTWGVTCKMPNNFQLDVLSWNPTGGKFVLPVGTAMSSSDPRSDRTGYQTTGLETAFAVNSTVTGGSHLWMGILNYTGYDYFRVITGNPAGALFYPYIKDCNYAQQAWGVTPILHSVADYSDNRNSGANPHSATPLSYYKDPDGILRRGDGNSKIGIYPNHPTEETARPIILNRAFKNVAELGYAYRDLPWKTLNLFSADSADAGLADLFTLDEEPEIVAGKVNLLSARQEVLDALLSGTETDPLTEGKLSGTGGDYSAKTIAGKIIENRNLIENKTDITKVMSSVLPETSNLDQALKWRREVVARGLLDSTQTRTWNLMIDLWTQAGHESSGGKDKSFVRSTQNRCWYHIAIDRYTGEVIEIQKEYEPLWF